MGCIYNNFDGDCQFFDAEDGDTSPEGCDEEGICICEDDPDPVDTCQSYESNWTCSECGQDLNVDECGCEDEEE